MDHWRRVLPSNRFLEVQYEDLTSAREGTLPNLNLDVNSKTKLRLKFVIYVSVTIDQAQATT
jgi:hypothetical protein